VLNTAAYLEKIGFEVTYLPVDRYGMVDPDDLRRAIRTDTILVSVMLANNEIGTIQPIKELCLVSHERGVLFHTDAVQAAGKLRIDVEELGVDLLSLSAHKIYGPKGVGALYIRKGTKIHPLIHGGHQERGRRAGTENVAGIVGFGKAAEIALQEMEEEAVRIAGLRDRLEGGILERIEDVLINGHPEKRLPNTTNISFRYIEGEAIILKLASHGIFASTGSACSSDTLEPSHVLMAIGLSPEVGHGSVRFSLGKFNTADDVDRTLEVLPEVVSNLREMSPFWREKNVQR
ncbi:MAG: cysteine desulfurase NifS, partial [Candidatus Hydrothermota bacterium]